MFTKFSRDLHRSGSFSRDARDVLSSLVLFLLSGAGTTVLFLVFLWDASTQAPFTEKAPTEIVQSLTLAACILLSLRDAKRRADLRPAFCLFAVFLGCMLIREQDGLLDRVFHGFWKWPAFALAAGGLARAMAKPAESLGSLAAFARSRRFPLIAVGLLIVLAYSRLFGSSLLWSTLLDEEVWRTVKSAAEESGELFGYFLMLFSFLIPPGRDKDG